MTTCHNKSEYAFSSMCNRLRSQDEAIEALHASVLHLRYGEPRVTREILCDKIAHIQIRDTQSITIKN
jgi:hypothetical protein